MLMAAMRHDKVQARGSKSMPKKTLAELSTFRPFNVLETNWEVWNISGMTFERYVNSHQ